METNIFAFEDRAPDGVLFVREIHVDNRGDADVQEIPHEDDITLSTCRDCDGTGYVEGFWGDREVYTRCGCPASDEADSRFEDWQISQYESRMEDREPPSGWEP